MVSILREIAARLNGKCNTFIEYDVEKDLQGQLGYWALHAKGIPVSAIGPEVIYGYRVEEIRKALKALGYPYRPASDN